MGLVRMPWCIASWPNIPFTIKLLLYRSKNKKQQKPSMKVQ